MLALPIGSIVVMRVYESALVRQTETGLITQSAIIAAMYRESLLKQSPMIATLAEYGKPLPTGTPLPDSDSRWTPRPAQLDLARSEFLPSAPTSSVDGVADETAVKAGAALASVLTHAQATTLAGLRVTTHDGIVVTSTGRDLGHNLSNLIEVSSAISGIGVSTLRHRDRKASPPSFTSISRGALLRVYVGTPVVIRDRVVGTILAMRTPRTLGSALYANRDLLIGIGLALFALTLLAGLLVSYAIVRPIKELRAHALRAVDGEPGAMMPLKNPVTRDIHELSGAVSTMARDLERRANTMREFASHVSHEFKTPLTAMRGSIELLQDHGDSMTTAERSRFVQNLDGDVRRLEKLVNGLLELTVHPPGGATSSSVTEVLNDSLFQLDTRIAVTLPDDATPLLVPINLRTLVSTLSSVCDNSFEHGASRVWLSAHQSRDNDIEIVITDDGPGVADDLHEKIFEPFFTTRDETLGHGLGLSLVASLLQHHGGSIASKPVATGAHFVITLPAAENPET